MGEVKEAASDKENIPKRSSEDSKRFSSSITTEDSKKSPSSITTKGIDVSDSPRLKEVESGLAASKKIKEESLREQPRQEPSRMFVLEGEAPSYYGLASTARRESRDLDCRVRDSYINDDLADEVEAIRLAADF